ncbi:hypothetical protein F4814DRAFT_402108 [Daldinia grandis]|nr:hypothetical protein F4814DRAFT_402108 [Daldinia grandis]
MAFPTLFFHWLFRISPLCVVVGMYTDNNIIRRVGVKNIPHIEDATFTNRGRISAATSYQVECGLGSCLPS